MAYPETYLIAREHFVRAAGMARATLATHVHPDVRAPNGEPLAIDVARLGREDAVSVLLSISGTHGLEGHSGSAVQSAFLETCPQPPSSVAVVLVHALNPYGIAWGTRGNEVNIDLSRNFVRFDHPLPVNAFYGEAHAMLAPDLWPDDSADRLDATIAVLSARHGPANALTGVTGGQYDRPDGLNYGGSAPAWSRRVLEAVCAEHLGGAARIAYIDFHTGFGRFGEPLFICFHTEDSAARQRVERWWGPLNRNEAAFDSGAAPAWRGLLWQGLTEWIAPAAEVCGAVIEFGTYPLGAIGEAVMADRWLRFGNPDDPRRPTFRRMMLERFDPASEIWRSRVVDHGRDLQTQALRGLIDWAASYGQTSTGR